MAKAPKKGKIVAAVGSINVVGNRSGQAGVTSDQLDQVQADAVQACLDEGVTDPQVILARKLKATEDFISAAHQAQPEG